MSYTPAQKRAIYNYRSRTKPSEGYKERKAVYQSGYYKQNKADLLDSRRKVYRYQQEAKRLRKILSLWVFKNILPLEKYLKTF